MNTKEDSRLNTLWLWLQEYFLIILIVSVVLGLAIYDQTNETSSKAQTESISSSTGGENNCTVDCSGHEAGYEWAEQNNITDTDYDNGNSESFNEGVHEYAEEQ